MWKVTWVQENEVKQRVPLTKGFVGRQEAENYAEYLRERIYTVTDIKVKKDERY